MNYSIKDEFDFTSKRNDVLKLRKAVIDRLLYMAEIACKIVNVPFEPAEAIYVTTDQILDIDLYNEESDGFINYHLDINNFPRNMEFKDKNGNAMDIKHCIPRRWLWEDFEEELKSGLYLITDEVLEGLKKERDDFLLLLSKLELSDEEKSTLGITEKLKELNDNVEYYHY